MTVQNPALFLQASSHPAEDVRRFVATTFDNGSGVVGSSDLAVTQNGTPNMSVNVAGGQVVVGGTEATYQGSYFCENRGTTNLVISAADATNPRRDLIIARVKDAAYSGAVNEWSLEVVTGTPAASPVDPSVPANSFVLARVAVAALASSVTNANITDLRTFVSTLGGAPRNATDRVGCAIRRSTNQSVSSSTSFSNISWNTEDFDSDGFFSPTSTTVTIPSGLGGLYAITFQVSSGLPPNGSEGGMRVIAGGNTYGWTGRPFAVAGSVGITIPLAAGNTITCGAFQSVGSPANFQGSLWVHRLSA